MIRSMVWLALFECKVPRAQGAPSPADAMAEVLHRFCVAYFSDQDDIRRLAQGILQGVVPGVGVDSDLSVCNQRLMRLVHEFNRVFHRNDVAGGGTIAMIDHRGKSRRFAGAGGTDHQNQAALGHHDVFEAFRQSERGKIWNLIGDGSDHHSNLLLLHERIDAEAGNSRQRDCEIAFQILGKLRPLTFVHQRHRQSAGDFRGQFLAGQWPHRALQLLCWAESRWRRTGPSPGLAHCGQQFRNMGFGLRFQLGWTSSFFEGGR